jgi:uncharacterized Zn-finger protein
MSTNNGFDIMRVENPAYPQEHGGPSPYGNVVIPGQGGLLASHLQQQQQGVGGGPFSSLAIGHHQSLPSLGSPYGIISQQQQQLQQPQPVPQQQQQQIVIKNEGNGRTPAAHSPGAIVKGQRSPADVGTPRGSRGGAVPTPAVKTKGWKGGECKRPKTYNCPACNKWFTSSGHLKRHYGTTLHKVTSSLSCQNKIFSLGSFFGRLRNSIISTLYLHAYNYVVKSLY